MPIFPDTVRPRMFNYNEPGLVFASDAGAAAYRVIRHNDQPPSIFVDMNRVVLPSDAKLHSKDFVVTSVVSEVYRTWGMLCDGKEPVDTNELKAFCTALYREIVGHGECYIQFVLGEQLAMVISMNEDR